jgi:hypothetical protein
MQVGNFHKFIIIKTIVTYLHDSAGAMGDIFRNASSDYAREMKQMQIDLVQRINRTFNSESGWYWIAHPMNLRHRS